MHPCQPSGVVHPLRRRMNRRRRRRAGVTLTAILFSGIRCRYAAADSRGVARVPLSSIFLPIHICLPGGPMLPFGRFPGAHRHTDAGCEARSCSILAPQGPVTRNCPLQSRAVSVPVRAPPGPGGVPLAAGSGGVGNDVDPPAGQLGSEAGVLALLADSQGKLVVRHHHPSRAGRFVRDGD